MATGAAAAVAMTFARYAVALAGLPAGAATPLAVAAIVGLSAVNVVGVAPGAALQSAFTLLKLAALAALIAAGVLAPTGVPSAPVGAAVLVPPTGAAGLTLAVGAALVPVLFAYGGWQQTSFVAAELRDAARTLPRAILLGVVVVVAVYLGANVAYLRALGVAGLAASEAPAADTMSALVGPAGRTAIAAGIAASTFGFLDLVILVSPRVYQAMARDGLFFARLAELSPRFRTPAWAIALQGAWAVLLLLTGSYGELLDYVVFADWIFFGLTATTLLVLRRRDAAAGVPEAGYRVPAAPVTVALFVAAAAYVVLGSVASNPGNAVRGTLLLALGVPVYAFWRARSARAAARAAARADTEAPRVA
jgi:APA family basic amino acid/polyamine antiporter